MKKHLLSILFFVFAITISISAKASDKNAPGTFTVGQNTFLLNGKPFVVRAGELHYTRIPKAHWDERIKLCKAMGMNTICIYIFWNFHEQQQGVFDFTGEKDVAEFVRLIQKNGMSTIRSTDTIRIKRQ